MNTQRRSVSLFVPVWMAVCAVFFLMAGAVPPMVTAQEITGSSGNYRTALQKEFNVQPGGKLIMEDIAGDVTVHSWGENRVKIDEQLKIDAFTKGEAEEIVNRAKSNYSVQGNTVLVSGLNGRHHLEQRFYIFLPTKFDLSVQTSGGDIVVEALSGNVGLKTSGGDVELVKISGAVEVQTSGGDLDFTEIEGPIQAHTSGGDVTLKTINGEADIKTSGGSIVVTDVKKNCQLHTSGGDIEIRNVTGDIHGFTSGGDIRATGCTGDTELKTSGGDLVLENINGRIDAATSGGDIQGKGFTALVNVATSGGDVELSDVQAAVTAATSGGDVVVEITLKDFTQPHGVQLRTSGGDIRVSLPEKIPATIVAEIRLDRDDRFWKRYDIYSDFPLSKTQTEEDRRPVIRCTGEINGGGDQILLQTSGGNIHILKIK